MLNEYSNRDDYYKLPVIIGLLSECYYFIDIFSISSFSAITFTRHLTSNIYRFYSL